MLTGSSAHLLSEAGADRDFSDDSGKTARMFVRCLDVARLRWKLLGRHKWPRGDYTLAGGSCC